MPAVNIQLVLSLFDNLRAHRVGGRAAVKLDEAAETLQVLVLAYFALVHLLQANDPYIGFGKAFEILFRYSHLTEADGAITARAEEYSLLALTAKENENNVNAPVDAKKKFDLDKLVRDLVSYALQGTKTTTATADGTPTTDASATSTPPLRQLPPPPPTRRSSAPSRKAPAHGATSTGTPTATATADGTVSATATANGPPRCDCDRQYTRRWDRFRDCSRQPNHRHWQWGPHCECDRQHNHLRDHRWGYQKMFLGRIRNGTDLEHQRCRKRWPKTNARELRGTGLGD